MRNSLLNSTISPPEWWRGLDCSRGVYCKFARLNFPFDAGEHSSARASRLVDAFRKATRAGCSVSIRRKAGNTSSPIRFLACSWRLAVAGGEYHDHSDDRRDGRGCDFHWQQLGANPALVIQIRSDTLPPCRRRYRDDVWCRRTWEGGRTHCRHSAEVPLCLGGQVRRIDEFAYGL